MKLQSKVCGISDINTLEYITNHPYPPEFIGFIVNYKKSKRYLEHSKLKKVLEINKKNSKYVAVLVNPTETELDEISRWIKDNNENLNTSNQDPDKKPEPKPSSQQKDSGLWTPGQGV